MMFRCPTGGRPYWTLLKYLSPLAFTIIAIDIGEQALNRALSNSFTSVTSLAAFGIAYMIIKLATGLISEVKLVSIMLVHSNADRRKIFLCVLFIGFLVFVFHLLVGLTKFGFYLFDDLHQVPADVGSQARVAILYLSVFPCIDGFAWLHTGILLKYKYSLTVGLASVLDNIFQVLTVVALLYTNLPETNVILVPVIATYMGTIARLTALLIVYYKYIHHQLGNANRENTNLLDNGRETTVALKRVVALWAPLGLVQLFQRTCRPIINLVVARDRLHGMTSEEAVKAVAVLSVCYPVGHLSYGWLNTLRLIQPAFTKRSTENERAVKMKNIRIFNLCCFLISFTVMLVIFWVPGIAPAILTHVSNVNQDIISKSINVLKVFSFFPIPVANRATCTGMLVSKEKSKYLYPSVFTRMVFLTASLVILPRLKVQGAIMGIAALLCGFLSESLCVLLMTWVSTCFEKRANVRKSTENCIDEDQTEV